MLLVCFIFEMIYKFRHIILYGYCTKNIIETNVILCKDIVFDMSYLDELEWIGKFEVLKINSL